MKLIIFILTFSLLTITPKIYSCDCDYQGTFLKVARKSSFVAIIKVNRYLTFKSINDKSIPLSIEVEVIRSILGNELRDTIIVWGDNGKLCRPYLNQFEVGKYYAIAFQKLLDPLLENVNNKQNDYYISNCGDYWLTVDFEKKMAYGAVAKKRNKILFGDLYQELGEK
jgi:hypothetical protein